MLIMTQKDLRQIGSIPFKDLKDFTDKCMSFTVWECKMFLKRANPFPKGREITVPEGMDPEQALEILEAVKRGEIDVSSYFKMREILAELKRFYTEIFREIPAEKIEAAFSTLVIPKKPESFNWLIVILEGLTREQLFAKCKKRFNGKAWKYYNDLDVQIIQAPRDTSKTYAIWVRDGQEADEVNQNKSFEVCQEEGINPVTAEERMVMELLYHWKTGKHLDLKTATITSSRDSDGSVVIMGWFEIDDEFSVNSVNPRNAYPNWRVRSAVS